MDSRILRVYYVSIFIFSFILSDLNTITIFKLGGSSFYAVDAFYVLCFVAAIKSVRGCEFMLHTSSGKLYIVQCMWLILAMGYGSLSYGFRALGEFRYVANFFAFFVPFAIFEKGATTPKEVGDVMTKTIFIAGLAGLAMFFIETLNGGRFFLSQENIDNIGELEDFRGVRFLDSYQTFNILLLASFLVIRRIYKRNFSTIEMVGIAVLLIASYVSKNRTAIYAIVGTILLFVAFSGKIKHYVWFGVVLVLAFITYQAFLPNSSDVGPLLTGLDPSEDPTGSWRLLQFGAALEQCLETPFLGQGFGGYFYFEVLGMQAIEAPPHNQFILLFLKTGGVGLLLSLAVIFTFLFGFVQARKTIVASQVGHPLVVTLLLIICSQLIYGMAYGFIPLYGLYFGFGVLLLKTSKQNLIPPLGSVPMASDLILSTGSQKQGSVKWRQHE